MAVGASASETPGYAARSREVARRPARPSRLAKVGIS
jgi:hypothetical protein